MALPCPRIRSSVPSNARLSGGDCPLSLLHSRRSRPSSDPNMLVCCSTSTARHPHRYHHPTMDKSSVDHSLSPLVRLRKCARSSGSLLPLPSWLLHDFGCQFLATASWANQTGWPRTGVKFGKLQAEHIHRTSCLSVNHISGNTLKIKKNGISKFSHVISLIGIMAPGCFQPSPAKASALSHLQAQTMLENLGILTLADLDPETAKLGITVVGPLLSAFAFLFIIRIVMSWYPRLPVEKFPYVIAYAPTEPILRQTRKVIPPVGGVDVTPVVWFGVVSFLNEILVGPQGLLVLLSQQM